MSQLLCSGVFHPVQGECIRKDGLRLHVLIGGVSYDEENQRSILFAVDLTELKDAQKEIGRLARIVESTDDAIFSISLDAQIVTWNKGAERLYGYQADEILGQSERVLIPADGMSEFERICKLVREGRSLERYSSVLVTKSGKLRPATMTISPLRDDNGVVVGISKISRDRTQEARAERLEEQFRQAQKLEALGRLAGGVAHDFNNILMVITSYAQMLEEHLSPDSRLRKNTQQILKAATRAATLTQHMLAFSRKQVLSMQIIKLDAVVEDIAKMVRRVIGEDIEFTVIPANSLWYTEADPTQITQMVLNLCINARDAMPTGGTLTVEIRNAVVDQQCVSVPEIPCGSYVMLSVADTGMGMTKEVQDHIFEPFFTTKEQGKGTGLGLSTVYGIVQQSGGYIAVRSEPGKGTCFSVYFPKKNRSASTSATTDFIAMQGRGETILVVEDDDAVREAICDHLLTHGYQTLEARGGQEALQVASSYSEPIHVLLTDVIMPKMTGVELGRRLKSIHKETLLLYMSGYADHLLIGHGTPEVEGAFISKPFALTAVANKLQELLVRAQPGQ